MSGKPTILVVDDDAPILLLMRNVLREFGFDSTTAASGEAALASARNSRPSLILVDRNMPGMNGEQLITALRQERSLLGVPILILSGEPVSPSDLERIQADGAVLKPFDLRALIDQIRSHLEATTPAQSTGDRADP
jgi:Response regulator containing CheY-like receiver, AAA-type ATPase, and DNA-binding domains